MKHDSISWQQLEPLNSPVVRVGDPPPTDPTDLSFLSVDTRTPYLVDYPVKTAARHGHSMLRRVATTGEKGPWSETASAAIGA